MNIPMRKLDRGAPTAFTGYEYGVKRRFETLLSSTSLKGKVVLDVGCGVGAYGKVAMKYGANFVVGLDINIEYLSKAELIERVQASADALPFKNSFFDTILMLEVLEHLPSDKKAIQEAKRVSKKDAFLIITAPNKFYPFETHGLRVGSTNIENILVVGIPFLSWMPRFVRERFERARIYSQKQLVEMLHDEGFKILKIDYMMPPLDKIQSTKLVIATRKVLRRLEATWLKHLGCHIIIIAYTREVI